MREVDRAELTYVIYSGLRTWSFTMRKQVFDRRDPRLEARRRAACEKIAIRLGYIDVFDDAGRQLGREQLTSIFVAAVDAFPGAIVKLWTSRVRDREREAQGAAANLLADAIAGYHVVTDSPAGDTVTYPTIVTVPHAMMDAWP